MRFIVLAICAGLSLLLACGSDSATVSPSVTGTTNPTATPSPTHYTYRVINTYPHDREAFTQGLIFEDDVLYEGTGQYGGSSIRRVDLTTGQVLQIRELPDAFFGEGITLSGERIVQLTWRQNKGFVYNEQTFDLLQQFTYSTEGWGITSDGERLIMSDGTETLHFLDPVTFEETAQVQVTDENGPVTRINELEYVEGKIYANIWVTNSIAIIDPATGYVSGWIDLEGLLGPEDRVQPVDVLNGIAYDAQRGRLFVTGKLWPKLFEIELVPN
ncbi:MAG: glutaminyl-peptide cyclotransferase [Dehalococcoidia bacterium]|nr:glutaminyl-peptide cyclotransferase [Dehalococcoidia bacterium]